MPGSLSRHSVVNIYVLKLARGKFYVGKTKHTVQRLRQHWDGGGAAWTRKYEMKDLYRWYPDKKDADENRITLQMMAEHGVRNVRGGDWCFVKMNAGEIRELEKKCRSKKRGSVKKTTTSGCKRCGRDSHTRSRCYAWTTVDGVTSLLSHGFTGPRRRPRRRPRRSPRRGSLDVVAGAGERVTSVRIATQELMMTAILSTNGIELMRAPPSPCIHC